MTRARREPAHGVIPMFAGRAERIVTLALAVDSPIRAENNNLVITARAVESVTA